MQIKMNHRDQELLQELLLKSQRHSATPYYSALCHQLVVQSSTFMNSRSNDVAYAPEGSVNSKRIPSSQGPA